VQFTIISLDFLSFQVRVSSPIIHFQTRISFFIVPQSKIIIFIKNQILFFEFLRLILSTFLIFFIKVKQLNYQSKFQGLFLIGLTIIQVMTIFLLLVIHLLLYLEDLFSI
jgi:hypothetical protein